MLAVETINLCKNYGKSRGIVDVNLQIQQGEIFGFIGPNGAGKSTTIRTLLNFIFPTSGQGTVMGYDIVKDSKKIKELIGYLPSEINYYDDMRIKDLLEYSGKYYRRDCSKKISELSERFELDLSKKIRELSLGNKKKVGILQALIHEPKLLILDEPTSGLDPLMQKTFFDVLKEENKNGTTIFFSSHILSEVQEVCNRVAIIKEGVILRTEEIAALRASQLKKITLKLTNTNINEINIPDIKNIKKLEDTFYFLYRGNMNSLINNLHGISIENLLIEEPSLEEIFMHYYKKEEN